MDRLKADFITSLPYAAGWPRLLLILNETSVGRLGGIDQTAKGSTSNLGEKRTPRRPVRSKQIEKKVLGAVLFGTIWRFAAAAQNSSEQTQSVKPNDYAVGLMITANKLKEVLRRVDAARGRFATGERVRIYSANADFG
jgi:hypothetical protein